MNTRTPNEILFIQQSIDSKSIKRYSNISLPAYRHIPGLTPHPIAHKDGHSYNKIKTDILPLTKINWLTNEEFLYAIDLFNYGYFWEAHETLEDFWMKADNLNFKFFLQGIIQISAAYLKWLQGFEIGMKKLSTKGLSKIIEVKKSFERLFGIDIANFIQVNTIFFKNNFETSTWHPIISLTK